jgi:hypothetical protein
MESAGLLEEAIEVAKTKGGRPLHTWGRFVPEFCHQKGRRLINSDIERRDNWGAVRILEYKLSRAATTWVVGMGRDSCMASHLPHLGGLTLNNDKASASRADYPALDYLLSSFT